MAEGRKNPAEVPGRSGVSPAPQVKPERRRFSILKKILIGLVVFIAVFAIVIAVQPADYRVTRSATISAPPADVFAQVNDFHKWQAWSPWAKLDPAMKQTYEGAPSGIGAIYTWSGNSEVGAGRMNITESHPDDLILIDLEFIQPFAGSSITEFTFKPDGDHTAVTWTMSGKNTFLGKAFHLFINMDKMIGGDFEKGLAQMKSVAEAK